MAQAGNCSRDDRLTLWALRRSTMRHRYQDSGLCSPALQAAALYQRYRIAARLGAGVREPRFSPPGSPTVTKDERRLLRAVAAARAGDEHLLDNRLYRFALDRPARRMLAEAVRAWAAALATGLRPSRRDAPTDPAQRSSTMNITDMPRPGPTRLQLAETTLLWAMRSWVAGRRRGVSSETEIGRIFAALGAPDATEYLCGLMWVLDQAACRELALHCPCDPTISADEQLLLDMLALTQERQGFERLLLLRTLLRPMAAGPAGQSANGLVQAFNRAGLFLTACNAPLRMCAFPSVA